MKKERPAYKSGLTMGITMMNDENRQKVAVTTIYWFKFQLRGQSVILLRKIQALKKIQSVNFRYSHHGTQSSIKYNSGQKA